MLGCSRYAMAEHAGGAPYLPCKTR